MKRILNTRMFCSFALAISVSGSSLFAQVGTQNQNRNLGTSQSQRTGTGSGINFMNSRLNSNGGTQGNFQNQTRNGPVGMRDTSQGLIGTNNFNGNTGAGNRNNGARRNGNRQNFGNQFNSVDQFGQNGMNGNNGMQNSSRSRPPIQPQHRVAFTYAPPASNLVTERLTKLLTRSKEKSKLRIENLKLELGQDGLVTLRGEVETEDQKRLAGMMTQFEPGVRKIDNQLSVRQPAKSSETLVK